MQPINYGVEIEDPTKSFLSAFQTGSAIQDTRLKQEQQQQKVANEKLIQEGFLKLRQPGAKASDYANLAMMLPETQAKAVRESFNMLTDERQQNALQQSGQIFSAFKAGKPEIAISLLERQIEAKRNSGDNEGAKFLETWRDVAKENPKVTEDYFGFTISQMPGGDKVITSAIALSGEGREQAKAPAKLRQEVAAADKAESEAKTALATATTAPEIAAAEAALKKAQADKAKIDAQYAEQKAKADLEQTLATTRKTDADILIAKEDNRIKALNAAQAKETNVLRRQELQQKIDDSTEKRNATDREQKALVSNQVADIDNFLNTAQRIQNTPEDIIKSATGPVASRVLTLSADVSDFEALVEALGSQAFIAQIPKIKGTGSLSEKEGDKLQASLQTLNLKQSPARLKENVTEAVRLLKKVRENIALKYGVQEPPLDVPAALEVIVQLPNKQSVKFPNQAAANAFKKQAGIP